MVTKNSTFNAYEIRRSTGQRMMGEPADNAPLQTASNSLPEQQAQNSLASSSNDYHVIGKSWTTNDMKYLYNRTNP